MTSLSAMVIDTIVKSSIILGLTFGITLALRRRSAALRHTVWTAGLLSALTLPLLSLALPAWQPAPMRAVQHTVVVLAQPSVLPTPIPATASPADAATNRQRRVTPAGAFFLFWLAGAMTVASFMLVEITKLVRVVVRCNPIREKAWGDLSREVSFALQLKRRIRLLRNSNASVLGTWGTLRPRVILPGESESWTAERRRVVLGHELAHVKRNDWLVQIVAEAARAIYWFNPLFWIACAHLRRESEHACDDAAIRLGSHLGIDGPAYAGHVLDIARTLKHSRQASAAALAMANPSNLERRLIAMLNPSLNRAATSKGAVAFVILAALAVTLPLAAMHLQVTPEAAAKIESTKAVIINVDELPVPATRRTTQSASSAVALKTSPTPVTGIVWTPQAKTGTLSGTISDQFAARIPGAAVTMTALSTGMTWKTQTDDSGNFSFGQLAPDSYSGTVDLANFKQGRFLYNLKDPGSSARLNFTLPIGSTNTWVRIGKQLPPERLTCFSIFGAIKADGTPFTAADCPGGTTVIVPSVPRTSAAPTAQSASLEDVVIVNSSPSEFAPAPSSAAGTREVIRVGGNLQPAKLLPSPEVYLAAMQDKFIEGEVVLSGVIAEDGHLRSLKIVSSSNPLLETSMLETVQGWIYEPTLLDGHRVAVMTTITINFHLSR